METSTKVLMAVGGVVVLGILGAVVYSSVSAKKQASAAAALPPTAAGNLVETDTSDFSQPLSIAVNQGIDLYFAGESASTGANWQLTAQSFAGGATVLDKGTSGGVHHFLVLPVAPSAGSLTFQLATPGGSVVKTLNLSIVVTPSLEKTS